MTSDGRPAAIIGVSTGAGQIALTLMLSAALSRAADLMSPATPCFDGRAGMPCTPARLARRDK
jgi:hypothetical protein